MKEGTSNEKDTNIHSSRKDTQGKSSIADKWGQPQKQRQRVIDTVLAVPYRYGLDAESDRRITLALIREYNKGQAQIKRAGLVLAHGPKSLQTTTLKGYGDSASGTLRIGGWASATNRRKLAHWFWVGVGTIDTTAFLLFVACAIWPSVLRLVIDAIWSVFP